MKKDDKIIKLFDEEGNEVSFNVVAFFDIVNPETDENNRVGCRSSRKSRFRAFHDERDPRAAESSSGHFEFCCERRTDRSF